MNGKIYGWKKSKSSRLRPSLEYFENSNTCDFLRLWSLCCYPSVVTLFCDPLLWSHCLQVYKNIWDLSYQAPSQMLLSNPSLMDAHHPKKFTSWLWLTFTSYRQPSHSMTSYPKFQVLSLPVMQLILRFNCFASSIFRMWIHSSLHKVLLIEESWSNSCSTDLRFMPLLLPRYCPQVPSPTYFIP